MPQTSPLTPDFVWDERSLRYRVLATGKFVSRKVIVKALDNVITASGANIETITQSLLDGNISLVDWRSSMAREMKIIHTAAAAASKGGWAQMTQSDWGKVGSLVKDQYKYLDNFAQELASGKMPLNGRVMVRAKLYAGASHGTFEEMTRRLHQMRGYTEERRNLTPGENCNGCIEQAGLGWQPIGELHRIGAEECRTNCVVGDTLIQSPEIEVGYRRFYDGEVIDLVTASGRTLTVTPNHPLLTNRGWVRAQLVKEGDYLVCGSLRKEVALGNPNVYDVPTAIADIFATRRNSALIVTRVMGSDVQFHGDGKEGDVDIVFSNRLLMGGVETTLSQPLDKEDFAAPDMMPASCPCAALKRFLGGLLTTPRRLSLAGNRQSFLGAHSAHAETHGSGDVADLHASFDEASPDRAPGDATAEAYGLLGFASEITLDQVVSQNKRDYVGHVYNLQTVTGWYIANSIITHNCRCDFEFR